MNLQGDNVDASEDEFEKLENERLASDEEQRPSSKGLFSFHFQTSSVMYPLMYYVLIVVFSADCYFEHNVYNGFMHGAS